MVGRVLAAMNREIRGLHEAAYILAIFTFLSQILALFRDRIFANIFGASSQLDAYFTAFRIPDLTFAFLTLFVSSFALVPLLAKRGGVHTQESRNLIGSVLAIFGIISILVVSALYVVLPTLYPLLFPGFSGEVQATSITLSKIMLLQPILLGVSSIVASLIQASRKFFIYALAPIFYNVGIIVGALFLFPFIGIVGLAWGVVAGAVLHVAVQVIPVFFYKGASLPIFSGHWMRDIREVAVLSLPRALALSSHNILLLAFVGAASLSAIGSVSVVTFAFNLQSVPLAVIGVSYASALFPSLALLFARGDHKTFVREVWSAVRHIVLWITLAISLMVVLRAHIVRVILGSGAFTWPDTRLTAAILAGFVLSLVAQAVLLIFSRAYYAAGRSWEPIVVNVGASLVAAFFAFASLRWFQEATFMRFFFEDLFRISGIEGTEVVMIALSYSLVMLLAAFVFAVLYARRFGYEAHVLKSILHSFLASVLAGTATYATLQLFGPLLQTNTFLGIFTQGLAGGIVGILVWGWALILLGSREFLEVRTIATKLLATHIK